MRYWIGWLITSLTFSACVSIPPYPEGSICIIDSTNESLRCTDKDKNKFDVPIEQSNKYICQPGVDFINQKTWVNKAADILKAKNGKL